MDALLVGVTVVSLLLALTMSAVAWMLWRRDRERSAARAEALEALAFSEPAPAASMPRQVRANHTAVRDEGEHIEAESEADRWDLALGDAKTEDVEFSPARGGSRPRTTPDELFATSAAEPAGTGGRLWLALAAVSLVIAAGVVVYRAIHSPVIRAAVSASRRDATTASNPSGAPPLELLSLRHSIAADGAFTVTGLVQNPAGGSALNNMEAVVYLFDDEGRYFASGKAPLDAAALDPGSESPFVIAVSSAPHVSRYRVAFRQTDGRAVAHVDRRGQLPANTTGDTIDAEPAMATPGISLHSTAGTFGR
jgi:hypothetical protein